METKELNRIEKLVWYMFVCLSKAPENDTKNAKKVKKGKTCKVLPVAMFVFANNQMFFVNLMIEMTMGSRLLQIGHNTQP